MTSPRTLAYQPATGSGRTWGAGLLLKGGGGSRPLTPPPSGAEFLEEPKAPKKIFGLN